MDYVWSFHEPETFGKIKGEVILDTVPPAVDVYFRDAAANGNAAPGLMTAKRMT